MPYYHPNLSGPAVMGTHTGPGGEPLPLCPEQMVPYYVPDSQGQHSCSQLLSHLSLNTPQWLIGGHRYYPTNRLYRKNINPIVIYV